MHKLIKDGKVAVLISPGYGAGWSTWNLDIPEILFDAEIADFILEGKVDEAKELAESKYPDAYLGGIEGLMVVWLPIGAQFSIDEYDGSESLIRREDLTFIA